MAEANDELCLLIQVESRTALENLDAILEVDGIDGVFIGRRISPPRWATRTMPVTLTCSG